MATSLVEPAYPIDSLQMIWCVGISALPVSELKDVLNFSDLSADLTAQSPASIRCARRGSLPRWFRFIAAGRSASSYHEQRSFDFQAREVVPCHRGPRLH